MLSQMEIMQSGKSNTTHSAFVLLAVLLSLVLPAGAQDWIRTGTGLGMEKVRLAVPDFAASTKDPQNTDLLKVFNETLWNDLD
ncbi:MAG: hypothetical protein ACREDQ_07745, partial [Limisphaerales bacterium]